jgi:ABC-type lipopolysaccharide export system ATPase subunit
MVDDVISLEHVFKRIGQRGILKDLTLAVKWGDIFGYLGPKRPSPITPTIRFYNLTNMPFGSIITTSQ